MLPNVKLCRRFAPWLMIVFLTFLLQPYVFADGTSASISITICDPSGALVPDASMVIRNIETNQEQRSNSGKAGSVHFSYLKPGHYTLVVSKAGFADLSVDNILLNVGDEKVLQLALKVGPSEQAVTVDGSGLTINTTDASVSTVVDRKFVANLPLNGRSFQDLISMTPGVLTASPQGGPGATQIGASGDFSVNGQRTQANYYTVDGVSANSGAGNGYGTPQSGSAGGVASGTAFGTTQSLASVDELQEFRVTSSTYSAEFGYGPGGQFSLITRSGSNKFHGTAFDYLRNNFFDANDWFNNHYGRPKPALRQNDFGGTLGGPLPLGHLSNTSRRTFFFASYEGLRITQPQAAAIQYVPDSFMRQKAPAALRPILDAFPTQNGIDYGTEANPNLAQFIASYAVPGEISSTSARFDHTFSNKLTSFFRFSNSSSSTATRSESVLTSLKFNTRTYTLGATTSFTHKLVNELRLGFTHSEASNHGVVDAFGGATPINLADAMGAEQYPNAHPEFLISVVGIGTPLLATQRAQNLQSQWNVVDSFEVASGHHQTKFGLDYRWIRAPEVPASPLALAYYSGTQSILNNAALEGYVSVTDSAVPLFRQFAAYVQDEWHIAQSLTFSAGLRWELSPPLGAEHGRIPYTLTGSIVDPKSLQLAPKGTPLWNTAKFNFAPRLGIAWTAHATPGWETVFRTGGGVFFDTSNRVATSGYGGIGYSAYAVDVPFSLPFSAAQLSVTPTLSPPYTNATAYAFPAHMQAPYALQWNVSAEQAIATRQTITLSYVASNGRRLVGEQELSLQALNPNFSTVVYFADGVTSNYQALQLKLQRSVSKGINALASYTWSHSLDFGSNDTSLQLSRGNSDFDVRHNVQTAITWDLPTRHASHYAAALFDDWGIDGRILLRTAFPITLGGATQTNPSTGTLYTTGLNYDPARPIYLYGKQYIGGKAINGGANNNINPAFSQPSGTSASGNAPRNFVRGFGLQQVNVALRRQFPLAKDLALQFRAEAFNVFNRPNFGYVDPTLTDATFGQPTTMLNGSLGTVAAQYQQGGARSMQFSLKLAF